MRKNIDTSAQAVRRREAWQSAAFTSLVRLAAGGGLLGLRWYYAAGSLAGAVLLIFALLAWGSIPPVWILLRTRLQEIEGGEEDAASQY